MDRVKHQGIEPRNVLRWLQFSKPTHHYWKLNRAFSLPIHLTAYVLRDESPINP